MLASIFWAREAQAWPRGIQQAIKDGGVLILAFYRVISMPRCTQAHLSIYRISLEAVVAYLNFEVVRRVRWL
jgi:hypothetical protein